HAELRDGADRCTAAAGIAAGHHGATALSAIRDGAGCAVAELVTTTAHRAGIADRAALAGGHTDRLLRRLQCPVRRGSSGPVPDGPRVRPGVELVALVALDLGRMRTAGGAARAQAAGGARDQLLTVEQVDIASVVRRRAAPLARALDDAEPGEAPSHADEPVR